MGEFSVVLDGALGALCRRRPVFHSEADFQFELAWELRSALPECEVRLERPVRSGVEGSPTVDLMVKEEGSWIAVELKYVTALLEWEHSGELFRLRGHSAQDQRRYDVVKDVQRIERLVDEGQADYGYSITLTNDSSLWREVTAVGATDEAFRIHEGCVIGGEMMWAARTSLGSIKGREAPVLLRGGYEMSWRDYSTIETPRNGAFRVLVMEVGP